MSKGNYHRELEKGIKIYLILIGVICFLVWFFSRLEPALIYHLYH